MTDMIRKPLAPMTPHEAPFVADDLSEAWAMGYNQAIAALPAVTVGVKPDRETFDAMCAMRDAINEYVPMPSLESDLLQGPENSVFCATVAEAVIAEIRRLRAAPDPAAPTYWSSAPPPEENLAHRAWKAGCDVEWNTQTGVVTIKPTPDAIDPAAIRGAALREAAQCAINNQDCSPWEISDAILALAKGATDDRA